MSYGDKYPDMSAMYAIQFEHENKLKNKITELETELERTRKALDVAVDALKEIDNTRSCVKQDLFTRKKSLNAGNVFCWTTLDEIHNTLEQITALEQKDVK